jgi:hypothetical protein
LIEKTALRVQELVEKEITRFGMIQRVVQLLLASISMAINGLSRRIDSKHSAGSSGG